MATLTSRIIAIQCLLRIGAYKGDPSTIATDYSNVAFTDFETESFPLPALYANLTGIEQEMALAVASNPKNSLRANIKDTVLVASGDEIPSVGSSSSTAKIIGEWGQVRDADSGKLLVPALREEEIRIITDNTDIFISSFFAYALRPPRIYATATNLSIDVCVYDFDARNAAIAAGGALIFPMSESAYFYGLMSCLKNEDQTYLELSNSFLPMYGEWLKAQAADMGAVEAAA